MYITTHATVGLLIARVIPNPVLAFILGFISHYILDLVPHDRIIKDPEIRKKVTSGEIDFRSRPEFKTFIMMTVFDFLIFFALIALISVFREKLVVNPISSIAAITGAALPDILWSPYMLLKWNTFKPFYTINRWVHEARPEIIPTWLGTSLQIIFVVVILYSIYF